MLNLCPEMNNGIFCKLTRCHIQVLAQICRIHVHLILVFVGIRGHMRTVIKQLKVETVCYSFAQN